MPVPITGGSERLKYQRFDLRDYKVAEAIFLAPDNDVLLLLFGTHKLTM